MKKKYKKPQIRMEKFELKQHIARCDWDFQNSIDAKSCYASSNIVGWETTIFTDEELGCKETIDAKDYEKYCTFAGSANWGATWNS